MQLPSDEVFNLTPRWGHNFKVKVEYVQRVREENVVQTAVLDVKNAVEQVAAMQLLRLC